MIYKILRSKLILIGIVAIPVLTQAQSDPWSDGMKDRKARGIESKGDRKFIQQDFDKAMKIYETAFKYPLSSEYLASLHLKVGRLFSSLSDYNESVPHYDAAMAISDQMFTAGDVCNYLDALRFSGQKMKAVTLARKYSFRDVYSKDQRYQNILQALDYSDGFMPVGSAEFSVESVEGVNTSNSEYWVGVKDGEYFYATSASRFHDPNKKFYYNSNYHLLSAANAKSGNGKFLNMIPKNLQSGPVTFSDDMSKMVVTQAAYAKKVKDADKQQTNAFYSRLYQSDYNSKRKKWSAFKEVFPQKEGYSYSHPCLIDNGKSLLFSSDIPGGFGGYDIYITHWDNNLKTWGIPVNLGAQVNTQGDEISPVLFNNMLIFSSNGHIGFGGYDIYSVSYEQGQAVTGSLHHFSYPVNTVMNDFNLLYIDENRGYFVSDRNKESKDDIFYFEKNKAISQNSGSLFGISEAKAISSGSINLLGKADANTQPRNEKIILPDHIIQEALTLYFDFDHYALSDEAKSELENWYKITDFNRIDTLIVEGYADEMGSEEYNYNLSVKRAQETAFWLGRRGVDRVFLIEGKGKILSENNIPEPAAFEMGKELPSYARMGDLSDKIIKNKVYRRVDIKAVTR